MTAFIPRMPGKSYVGPLASLTAGQSTLCDIEALEVPRRQARAMLGHQGRSNIRAEAGKLVRAWLHGSWLFHSYYYALADYTNTSTQRQDGWDAQFRRLNADRRWRDALLRVRDIRSRETRPSIRESPELGDGNTGTLSI